MFNASYKVTHSEEYIEEIISSDYGYAIRWSDYVTNSMYGFRPIICLENGIQLIEKGDGTYNINK